MTLLDETLLEMSQEIASKVKTFNLGETADFQDNFVEHLFLKPYKI